MSFYIGRIKFSFHPILPFIWLFSALCGNINNLLPTILALTLHESGHFLFARILKMKVLEVEITPHGGLIRMENMESASPLSSFLLAAAGPLFSMLGCIIIAFLYYKQAVDFQFAQKFAQCNALLMLINLFPALPLDGGRMLLALFSHFLPRQHAGRLLIRLGYVLGGLLCAVSLYFSINGEIILSPAFAGVYIIYSATQEGKNSIAHYVTSLIARRNKLDKNEILPVEYLAASGAMPLYELLGRMRPGKYHIIFILAPDGMERIGTIEEKEICNCLLSKQKDIKLSECIQKS